MKITIDKRITFVYIISIDIETTQTKGHKMKTYTCSNCHKNYTPNAETINLVENYNFSETEILCDDCTDYGVEYASVVDSYDVYCE